MYPNGTQNVQKLMILIMARTRKAKAKEPVKVWFKALRNGNKAIYLRSYVANTGSKGYKYENLGMYLVPEVNAATKNQNKNTLLAVEAIKAQRIIDAANGKASIKKADRTKKTLLVDWLKHYAAVKAKLGQSKSNAVTINNVLLHLIKYKGDGITMAQVNKAYCEGFVLYLATGKTIGTGKPKNVGEHKEKPIAASTARLYFNTFVTALNEAVRDGVIDKNPTAQLKKEEKKPLKRSGNDRGYLEIEEVKKLMKTPCNDEQIKMAFLFACFCGLRLSDIKDLKWQDVKYDADGKAMVSKIQVKTRQSIVVPLSANALKWMPNRINAKEQDAVFDLPTHFTINRSVKKWAKDAEIKKNVTFHLSRHTFATTLLTMGADIYTTSKLLGHQNLRTTQIYAEVVSKKKAEAVNLMDNVF